MDLLTETELRERIERLAAIERGSASPGEAEAAELIAAELREQGARVELEREPAHGTYWWPVGLLTAASALAGARLGRFAAVVTGLFSAAAVTNDITGGSQWFRRTFLPRRETTNVVAELGDADAPHTVVLVAHHDAAHSGLVFHPDAPRALLRRFPKLAEDANTTPGTMWGAVGGPLLVALGALFGLRRLRGVGTFLSVGYTAAMADIGLRRVVPGANDNLTAVAVLLSLARSLRAEPVDGVRVILLSTGSEESFMEGMQGFARRHFPELDRGRTTFVCVDTVGSPNLLALEGEGMVWMNEYPKDLLALVQRTAAELDIELVPDLRLRNATDGLLALRAGYPTVALCSVDDLKIPTNYHWPTDTPENVDYSTVADCARLCRRLVERLAGA
jgi:acetylornithine deacetylase/succinyl-diaminopimelate desuccinylase-like protein